MSIKITLSDQQVAAVVASQAVTTHGRVEASVVPQVAQHLHMTDIAGVWGIGLSEMHHFYSNKHIVNPTAGGTIMQIVVPRLRRDHVLKITDVQDERNRTQFRRYGRISTHPDFEHDVISEHYWGVGGHVDIHLGPASAGKRFYFCHRIADRAKRHNHWYSTLQMSFM